MGLNLGVIVLLAISILIYFGIADRVPRPFAFK